MAAWREQKRLHAQRKAELIPDTLLLLEHPPVFTLGRRALDTEVLASPSILAAEGIEVVRTDRGGQTTYHGPGQLVGYLIFNLYNHGRRLKLFVEHIEEVFIRVLADSYGIEAGRDPDHRGVWVGNEKIAAIGIAVQESVTLHGFAFNVAPRLEHFDLIVPCGITDRGQTSISRLLGREESLERVKPLVAARLADVFGYDERRYLVSGVSEEGAPSE